MSRIGKLWFIALFMAIGLVLPNGKSPLNQNSTLVLAMPAFAQTERSFLETEAGITAYVNVGQSINLTVAKSLYKVLEDETETYLIGTVELPGYDEWWWPHAWIEKSGWIVVYYPADRPTSILMYWRDWSGRITTTTLREALLGIGRQLGLDPFQLDQGLRYYHFQFPKAERILIVVDDDSFQYTIPENLKVYELSMEGDIDIDGASPSSYRACLKLDGPFRAPGKHTATVHHGTGALFFLIGKG